MLIREIIKNIIVKIFFTALIMLCIAPVSVYSNEMPESNTEIKTPIPVEASPVIPFRSDKYRYQNMWLVPRIFTSMVSCTLSFIEWDRYDWLTAGGVTLSTAAFMVPFNGLSTDARLHHWVRDVKNKNIKPVFPHIDSATWVYIVSSWTMLFYGTGWITRNSRILEYISLTLEAIGLTQFYHISFKMLMGREGPPQGDGRGVIHGPAHSIRLWPYGTPSGHIATLYAMTTVAAEYFDSLALKIISHVAGAYYAVNIIYNEGHFISDLIWGAAIGYFVAQWVVKHRSSKYTYTRNKNTDRYKTNARGPNHSSGEIIVFPFFNMSTNTINLCVNYTIY